MENTDIKQKRLRNRSVLLTAMREHPTITAIRKVLDTYNLSTYFLLPLAGMNMTTFGGDTNYLNCFLGSLGELIVEVQNVEWCPEMTRSLINWENDKGTYYIHVDIPEHFLEEYELYKEGKYSEFSQKAKDIIYTHSGLLWKGKIGGKKVSDVSLSDYILLAFNKSKEAKKYLEDMIYETCYESKITEDMELLSKPTEKDYIVV